MSKVKRNVKSTKKIFSSPFSIYWNKNNYIFLIVGFLTVVAGYLLLSNDGWNNSTSLIISPIVLMIGYFVLLPFAIFYKKRTAKTDNNPVSK